MADRIAVIDRGQVVQYGPPGDIWSRPANRFVAELFCDTDAFDAHLSNGELTSAFGLLPSRAADGAGDGPCVVIARPEAVRLSPQPGSQNRVIDTRFLGNRYLVTVANGADRLRASLPDAPPFAVNDAVAVHFETSGLFVYNRE